MTEEGKQAVAKARAILENYKGKKLRIMEVCGTHTHAIFKAGLRQLMPENVELISGPGCPVCVTPADFIDEAVWLATEKNAVITTFGDLVRVPGSEMSLAGARSEGADIVPVYTPIDAVEYAKTHPDREVVFLSVGFETTTPSACLAVQRAEKAGLKNFSILTANKTMDEAYRALKDSVDAYIYPGHVCAIVGTRLTEELTGEGISGVVAGFTPSELVTAAATLVELCSKSDEPFFRNCYPRVVTRDGSAAAKKLVEKYMEPADAVWRGLGIIPKSGMVLRDEYAAFDARKKFTVPSFKAKNPPGCRCGEILQGKCKPTDCPLFGKTCTPEHPVGACMVSQEGTCAAYYQYGGVV